MKTVPAVDPVRLVAAVLGVVFGTVCLALSPLPWLAFGWLAAVCLLVAFDDGGGPT